MHAFGRDTGLSSSSAWLSLCEHWAHSKTRVRLCCEGHQIAKSFYFFLLCSSTWRKKAQCLQRGDSPLLRQRSGQPPRGAGPGRRGRLGAGPAADGGGAPRPRRQAAAPAGTKGAERTERESGADGRVTGTILTAPGDKPGRLRRLGNGRRPLRPGLWNSL